jgi:hypothetical protein
MYNLLKASILFGIVLVPGCSQIDRSITRSLEEDKSYTRHVVEYHRKHPNKRNDGVTVTWSTADYVAMAIAKQRLEGEWAKPTDQLSFLPDNLKLDQNGRPFCVIQRADSIIVLAYLNKTPCEPSWKGIWSASFFSVPHFAGYKTDSDISEAVKNGQWGRAYVGEFDRSTQILTILPLDSAKRRTEKLILKR